jgi:hypothetical protein
MRSDILNKNSNSYGQISPDAGVTVDFGSKKIVTFAGSLTGITAAAVTYSDNDIMQYLGALDVTVPSGCGTPNKILIEKAIFSVTTACGQTLVGNFQLSATGGSAENGAVTTGTEIFGVGASMVAPDGSGGTTGYTEADLNFNSAAITYASPNIEVATSLIHVYACTTTTLSADATAGRFSLQLEYSVI